MTSTTIHLLGVEHPLTIDSEEPLKATYSEISGFLTLHNGNVRSLMFPAKHLLFIDARATGETK